MNTFIIILAIICSSIIIFDVVGSIENMYQVHQNRLWLQHLSDNGQYQDSKGFVYKIGSGNHDE